MSFLTLIDVIKLTKIIEVIKLTNIYIYKVNVFTNIDNSAETQIQTKKENRNFTFSDSCDDYSFFNIYIKKFNFNLYLLFLVSRT